MLLQCGVKHPFTRLCYSQHVLTSNLLLDISFSERSVHGSQGGCCWLEGHLLANWHNPPQS